MTRIVSIALVTLLIAAALVWQRGERRSAEGAPAPDFVREATPNRDAKSLPVQQIEDRTLVFAPSL